MDKLVKVEGELVVKDGTGRMIEFYEEEFILDESVDSVDKARSLIKKGLITERLQRKVSGFKAVRTVKVISIEDSEEKADDSDLTKAMLKAIELNCVPQNIDSYKRTDYKLKALEKAITAQEERNAKKGE